MTRDRRELQSWYRDAMLSRIDELVALRPEVEEGSASACDRLRKIGQALRGSGGTFGFPGLSAVAGLVETTTDSAALGRLEGLLVELRRLAGEEREEAERVFEWLRRCVGPTGGASDGEVHESLQGARTVAAAWTSVARVSGLDDESVAQAVADRFGLEVAALTDRSPAARRLVPEAFMASAGIVPLTEDSTTITVATADPVSLPVQLELQRLTGRRPVYAVASPSAIDAILEPIADGPGAQASPMAERPAVSDAAVAERSGKVDGAVAGEGARAATSDVVKGVADAKEGVAGVGEGIAGVEEGVAGVGEGVTTDEGGSTGVLVVDDEESARLLVRSVLEKRGFTTIEASDGLEALEVIRDRKDVGLAVVDLNMPRMDGLELMWRMRDAREWADLPVIVVTGERDEILEAHVMEEGADDYIRKPVDPRLFLARVEATLRRRPR